MCLRIVGVAKVVNPCLLIFSFNDDTKEPLFSSLSWIFSSRLLNNRRGVIESDRRTRFAVHDLLQPIKVVLSFFQTLLILGVIIIYIPCSSSSIHFIQ